MVAEVLKANLYLGIVSLSSTAENRSEKEIELQLLW